MYKHSFLDYLELIENCRNSQDELFYLNTEVELRNFRKMVFGDVVKLILSFQILMK